MARWASDIYYQVDLSPVQLGNKKKGICAHRSVAITEGTPWIHQLVAILFIDDNDFRMT